MPTIVMRKENPPSLSWYLTRHSNGVLSTLDNGSYNSSNLYAKRTGPLSFLGIKWPVYIGKVFDVYASIQFPAEKETRKVETRLVTGILAQYEQKYGIETRIEFVEEWD